MLDCCPKPATCLEVKGCKSKELRGGILYATCDCVKQNGLQDHCPRTECGNCCVAPQCPKPCCCPSQFSLRYINMTMGIIKRKPLDVLEKSDSNNCNKKERPSCGCKSSSSSSCNKNDRQMDFQSNTYKALQTINYNSNQALQLPLDIFMTCPTYPYYVV